MINKILNEMKEVREEKDYRNYRTLSSILAEYITNTYFSSKQTLYGKELEMYIKIFQEISKEIIELNKISTSALENKKYEVLKIVTQSTANLQRLNQTYDYLCEKNLSCN